MLKRPLLILVAALVACGPASQPAAPVKPTPGALAKFAPPADADSQPLPLWPEVHKGVLSNGMTYYVLKHGKPEKRAFFWLAVNAGSVLEDEDQRGLAHFDEHMAFNGTKRFPKQEIISYLQSIGMRFGADLNAYTNWDETVYQIEVPTDKPEFLSKGLDILRDFAGDATYDPKEVESERGVVLEEWRLGRGAGKRLFDKQSKVLFAGSRYADRITIGDPEIIKHAPRDTVYRFYKDWYRPDLMAVICVGDFDAATIEKQIEQKFGDLRGPAKERTRIRGGVPPATGTRVSIETDKETPVTTVAIDNLVSHRPVASKRDYRRSIAEQLYQLVLDERLASIARHSDAPFMRAGGVISTIVRDIDAFNRVAIAKTGHVEDALRALLTEVVRIERHGISAGELERARANIARAYQEAAETEDTTDGSDFTDEITRNFFRGELMVGRTAERELALSVLPKITVDELNATVKAFDGADSRAIIIAGPEGQPLPSKEAVMKIVAEVAKADIGPWEDKAAQQALMAKPPTPGKITKETQVAAIGVTEWTLSNGARVIVKPTDFEKDNVQLAGESPGGDAMASDKDYPNARFADEVVEIGGVGELDAETLQKVLTGKQVQVSTRVAETVEQIEASGSAHDLETMLQLVYLRVTAPRKDPQQFAVWKQNFTEQLTNFMRSPQFKFSREVATALYKNQLRRKPLDPADIAKVDLDKAFAFYQDRFGDVSDFTFVIVGAVDLAKLKPLVETYLASLPGKARHEKEKDLKIRKVGGVVKTEFKLGTEPKAAVQLDFHGDEAWTRDKDRDMFILGQVLGLNLHDVLREEKGGVYGVRAGGSLARSPHQERSFTIQFGCAPDRVAELITATFDEIAKLEKDGVPQDHLDKVKEMFTRARETELRQNGFWVGWLVTSYRFGDDPTLVLDPSKMLARITSDNIKAAAKRYLDLKQYFQAVMLPAAP